ncbi:hypothetical protein DFH07DRAFT_781386 [Mycena maculata]|uniref:G-protein coupled receptors family 2 profile 2 domain-containing protein n=1 Tax=Mycena maculata TaxID=230809 RepID=A0AAD7HYB6_9AGAR|nr:hypothetical protein DFH07DRAFT_781386 [Mycena maculata]
MAGLLSSTVYISFERNGVIALVAGGMLSFLAVLFMLVSLVSFSKKYSNTHFVLYFPCLLLADFMQAFSSVMSLNWVKNGGVYDGPYCAAQGGLKNGGNVAAALWTFTIAWHLFNLLFRRYNTPKLISWAIVAFGWSLVFTIVFLGPVAIQTTERGHYFGISGKWCWISGGYRREQILLQYLFEGLSVVMSSFMYIATLLRVCGNLLKVDGRWTLRFLPKGDSWKLDFGRDFTDSIAYAALIVPIALVRIGAFAGVEPPFAITVLADFIFGLSGFVDVVLFLTMYRIFPEQSALPEFTARRKTIDVSVIQYGITPFALEQSIHLGPTPVAKERPESLASMASINSQTPLHPS